MAMPKGLEWELLIVDNNSTDKTKEVVDDYIKTSWINCRYVFESKQGHSYARNRGVNEASGEIIAFTDDDVLLDQYWLKNIDQVFKGNNISCVGGRIFPIWEIRCPEWLSRNLWNVIYLYGGLALLDYGEKPLYLNEAIIWGANFAVKKEMFDKYGIFNTLLGRVPGKLYAGEETTFIGSLIENGEKVLYAPDIIVHHCIPAERMRKSYFRKWLFDHGELSAIKMGIYSHRNILGIPLYLIKSTAMSFIRWVIALPLSRDRCFIKELELLSNIGFIFGRLRLRWRAKYET